VSGSGTAAGVKGFCTGSGSAVSGDGNEWGYGVYGAGDRNFGVYGYSTRSYGVRGGSGSSYGVYSSGDFHATGNVSCDGTKSSIANTEHSGERLLYAIESTEVWFEDFGADTLVNGVITVTIEPIFAQTVNLTEDYHIFVTPISDEPVLLFITDKGDASFTVRGVTLDGETAECDFDWRISAHRLGYENVRLEPIPQKLVEAREKDEEMAQEGQHPVPEALSEEAPTGVTQ